MDMPEHNGSEVMNNNVMATLQELKKKTSFMQKLIGVKNSQCDLFLDKLQRDLDQVRQFPILNYNCAIPSKYQKVNNGI